MKYHAWIGGGATAIVKTITFETFMDIFDLGNEHYFAPNLVECMHGYHTIKFNYAKKLILFGDDTPGSLSHIEIVSDGHAEIEGTRAVVGFVVI